MGCSWVSPRCPSLPRVKWWDTAKGCGRILSFVLLWDICCPEEEVEVLTQPLYP